MNNNRDQAKKSLSKTITKMLPAVFTALVATGIGFFALYTSPVPMIQDFGKMLTIGLIVSFILSVFLLLPVLFMRDYFFKHIKKAKQQTHQEKAATSKMNRTLKQMTTSVIKWRWMIIGLAIVTASFGIWVDLDANAETDVETFMPQDTQELKDIHKLRDVMGTTDQISIVYEGDEIVTNEVMKWVDHLTEEIRTKFPDVVVDTKSITGIVRQINDGNFPEDESLKGKIARIPSKQLKLFLNDSKTKGVITVGIKHLEIEILKQFIGDLEVYLAGNTLDTIQTTITGKALLDIEMIEGLTTGRYQMTLLGMGLVFFSLLIIYRHPVKAFIPLLPIIFIVGWSGLMMYFLDISYTPLTATLGALIIGIGTEFTVLMMERFYEEREKGLLSHEAIQVTNTSIGKAIFASALTTIGGFSALLISDFIILNNFGMMTLINISLALFSTFIVMPPILVILDRFISVKQVKNS